MSGFINENVGLFYARDKYENILLINEINETNKGIELICPICGTEVKPKALNSDKVSPHFYHVAASEHTTESVLHWWYKNQYLIPGDTFSISVDGENHTYICKSIDIEKQYKTAIGVYQPDVVITTSTNEEIFFEYNYTNKKSSDDYAEKWIELGRNVVELNVKSLITKKDKVFKPIFFDGVVRCKSRSERYGVIEKHISERKITDRIRIKYLNGFLRDVFRYNQNEITIDDLAVIIDSMNEVDKLFIPRLLKKLKCNEVLNDYSQYKFKEAKCILDDLLSAEKGLNGDYGWLLECGYSQKWTKCRGARFNNTIYVKKYNYSRMYNYNRCKYNDISKGFDILFFDKDTMRLEIIKTIENERNRQNSIKKDRVREHIGMQVVMIQNTINNYIRTLNIDEYEVSRYSITHKEYPCINKRIDFYEELKGYKGIGRYKEIERMVEDECLKLSRDEKHNIDFCKAVDLLSYDSSEIKKYCDELFNFNVIVVLPQYYKERIWRTSLSLFDETGIHLMEIDLKDVFDECSDTDQFIERIKKAIKDKFTELSTLERLYYFVSDNCYGKSYYRCETEMHNGYLDISFFRRRNPLKCHINISNNVLTFKYIENQYRMALNNLFEAMIVIKYVYHKLG